MDVNLGLRTPRHCERRTAHLDAFHEDEVGNKEQEHAVGEARQNLVSRVAASVQGTCHMPERKQPMNVRCAYPYV